MALRVGGMKASLTVSLTVSLRGLRRENRMDLTMEK